MGSGSTLETPAVERQFNISETTPLTYNGVLRLTAQSLGRSVLRLHVPAQPMVTALRNERFGIFANQSRQVMRLNEDKAFSYAEATEAFGAPR